MKRQVGPREMNCIELHRCNRMQFSVGSISVPGAAVWHEVYTSPRSPSPIGPPGKEPVRGPNLRRPGSCFPAENVRNSLLIARSSTERSIDPCLSLARIAQCVGKNSRRGVVFPTRRLDVGEFFQRFVPRWEFVPTFRSLPGKLRQNPGCGWVATGGGARTYGAPPGSP